MPFDIPTRAGKARRLNRLPILTSIDRGVQKPPGVRTISADLLNVNHLDYVEFVTNHDYGGKRHHPTITV